MFRFNDTVNGILEEVVERMATNIDGLFAKRNNENERQCIVDMMFDPSPLRMEARLIIGNDGFDLNKREVDFIKNINTSCSGFPSLDQYPFCIPLQGKVMEVPPLDFIQLCIGSMQKEIKNGLQKHIAEEYSIFPTTQESQELTESQKKEMEEKNSEPLSVVVPRDDVSQPSNNNEKTI